MISLCQENQGKNDEVNEPIHSRGGNGVNEAFFRTDTVQQFDPLFLSCEVDKFLTLSKIKANTFLKIDTV